MNPLVKEIRTEVSQWGLLVVDTEYDECPQGTMLAVTEMPGAETLCRVSLIGPMRETVTKDGALMASNLPEHLRGITNGRRIRHICYAVGPASERRR